MNNEYPTGSELFEKLHRVGFVALLAMQIHEVDNSKCDSYPFLLVMNVMHI